MEFFLIFPLVFACAAASLAKSKNRNPYVWFPLGLVLGPFAVLIVAMLKTAPGVDQGYH